MIYELKCDTCGLIHEFENPISVGPPKDKVCTCEAKTPLHTKFSSAGIHIPDYMKAGQEGHMFTSMNAKMKKSRPSGKDKVYY